MPMLRYFRYSLVSVNFKRGGRKIQQNVTLEPATAITSTGLVEIAVPHRTSKNNPFRSQSIKVMCAAVKTTMYLQIADTFE